MRLRSKFQPLLERRLIAFRKSCLRLDFLCERRPKLVFAAVLFASAVALAFLPRVGQVISLNELLDPSFPTLDELRQTETSFNDGRFLTLVLSPAGGQWTERTLCAISKFIDRERLQNSELAKAFSVLDLQGVTADKAKVFYPRLLRLDCSSPGNRAISLEKFRKSPWQGLLVSPDLRQILIQFDFNASAIDPKFKAFSIASFQTFMSRWREQVEWPEGIQSRVLGSATYETYLSKGTQDFIWVNLALVVVILLLFRSCFGTWRSGVLYLISLSLALLWVLGLMGALRGSLDVLANSLTVIVAVATMQDLTFVGIEMMENQTPARRAFRRLAVPGFFTSLTTIVGFGSLLFSSLAMVRAFGLWAAAAAFFEWLLVFFFLPRLVRPGMFFSRWLRPEKAWLYRYLKKAQMFSRSRWLRWQFIVIVALVAPWGLRFDDEPKLLFPKSHEFRRQTEEFVKAFGWEYSASLVFRDSFSARDGVVDELKKNPAVMKIESAAQGFDWVTAGLEPMDRKLVEREFTKILRPDRYFGGAGLERYHVYLKTSEVSEVLSLKKRIDEICSGGCYLTGSIVTYAEFVHQLSKTLFESLSISLGLVILILYGLAIALKFEKPWLLIYSSIWGPAALLLLIVLFRVPMNLMTSLCAAVSLGLTGDNAIEFLFAKRGGDFARGLGRRFGGAIATSSMMSLGCLTMLIAPFAPPRTLGVLFAVGFALSLIGDYFVLDYLWRRQTRNGFPNPLTLLRRKSRT